MFKLTENEEQISKYWSENKILEKTRQQNKGRKPFYFLDGPPFVSGDLHPGQMWVKSMKDVILRYRRFCGYDVYDKAGYDVHGLPIEKRAEAQLGIKSKKEIEESIGVEKFIMTCREYVDAYIGRMDKDYYRFGMSLDFGNPYIPSRMPYMEIAWDYLKRMSDKGFLYRDVRSTTYCKSCGTSVSQGSMEVEYRNDTDPSIFVAFDVDADASANAKITPGSGLRLLIWTTTPWTLPANVAVAVHPDERYVVATISGKRYVMIKSSVDRISEMLKESVIVESEFPGSDLAGICYRNPLEAEVPMQKKLRKYHRVIMAKELVSSSEGSGLVHIAPGHGLEDYLIGKKNRMPIVSPVDKQGLYTADAGKYSGLSVPDAANKQIIDDLKKIGALVDSSSILHSYPHCWRCDTKLIFMATDQWFINIQKVKKKLISENKKVLWHPAEAQKWQEDVIQSSPDWAISRQRYWGIPMPIWECKGCGKWQVVGSLKELRSLSTNKDFVDSLTDLHRPYIDNVVIKCQACGSSMERIKDVLDVWFDSSIAFRASLTEDQFNLIFPMDFILEAIEQLRGWFSYQLKSSVIVHGKRPFKNVVMHGMMLGSDGREMHKKIGNYVPLNDLLKTVTADAFRLWCTSHTPQLDLIFNMDKINEANKSVILLYNISNLTGEYSEAMSYKLRGIKSPGKLDGLPPEDAWIISRLNSTIKYVTENLDRYEIYRAVNALRSFIVMDLSRFYLKLAKKRILSSASGSNKTLNILNYVFFNTLILMAPITPFASEKIYLDRFKFKESIFLERWPKWKAGLISAGIEGEFEAAMEAVTAILSSREKAGIKLRQPLSRAIVEVNNEAALSSISKLSGIIMEYTNVKELEVKMKVKRNVEIKPNFSRLGPDFKDKSAHIAQAIRSADHEKIAEDLSRHGEHVLKTPSGEYTIRNEHVIKAEKAENDSFTVFRHGTVSISSEIGKELQDEARLREFQRRVQIARKEMGLRKGDSVRIFYKADPEMSSLINANAENLKQALNASSISSTEELKSAFTVRFEISGKAVHIGIER